MDPIKNEPDKDETIFADIDLKSKERKKHITNARLLLFGMAALLLYPMIVNSDYFVGNRLFWQIVMIGFYLAMAFWARQNPLYALSATLIFWLVAVVIDFITRPPYMGLSIMDILVNGVIITLLGLGIRNAWALRIENKKEQN